MSGPLFGSVLIATIVCWVILLRTEPGGRRRRALLVALAAAPFLLFSSIVISAFLSAPAGEYRVALEAVSFRFGAGDTVTVGGDSEGDNADDLIVRDLPPHYLSFKREKSGIGVWLPPASDSDNENPSYAAVRVDDARPFANSVRLDSNCTIGGRELDPGERVFKSATESYPPIPKRKQDLLWWSIPILRNLPAETAMYPLRFWERPAGTEDPVTGTNGALLGSFLSFHGGFFRNSLYLTLVGDGTEVALPGKPAVRYERKIAQIDDDGEHHFALYRLDYADPAREEDARSVAQERRSFRAIYKNDRLSLVFDTPDTFRLASENIAQLLEHQKEKDSFLLITRDPRRNAPVTANQMVLSFRQLGPRIQNELYSAVKVAEKGDCSLRVTTHSGTKCFDFGDAFRIGDNAAAVLRLTRMQIPWALIATLVILFLISIGWPDWLQQNAAIVIVISAAEMLLAVRLLIAFEGGIIDSSAASALWESLVIYAMLPLTLRMAAFFGRRRDSLLGSIRLLTSAEGLTVHLRAVLVGALIVVALLRANIAMTGAVAIGAAVVLLPLIAGIAGHPLMDRFTRPIDRRALLKVCAFGLAIAALRVLMWIGFGWKERIALGNADLAVTALYLPLVFLFFALLWRQYTRVDASLPLSKRSMLTAIAAAAAGALLTIVLPYAVRDSGSVFVHLPAVLLLFALPALARPTPRTVFLAVPLLLLLIVHTVVFLIPTLRGADDLEPSRNPAYRSALASETQAEDFLEQRLKASTNTLRLMSQIAPHQLEQAGTSKAEGLVVQRRMLDRYSGRGLWGAGFLNVPMAVFRDTHLNDNLSAIHVLAPFGILGGAGILGLLAALATLPLYAALRPALARNASPEETIDAQTALAILSLWTFCIAGIYMFAANVGLVLFTGKNVYLMAAASKSDAVEGGLLLLIPLLAFVTVEREQ